MNNAKTRELPFIILIPIFILLLAFVFDNAMIVIQNARVEKVTTDIINESLTTNVSDYYKKVKEMYEKKKIDTEHLDVNYESEELFIYNSHSYPSFFGKIIGINSYRSEIIVKAYLKGDEVIINEASYDEEA